MKRPMKAGLREESSSRILVHDRAKIRFQTPNIQGNFRRSVVPGRLRTPSKIVKKADSMPEGRDIRRRQLRAVGKVKTMVFSMVDLEKKMENVKRLKGTISYTTILLARVKMTGKKFLKLAFVPHFCASFFLLMIVGLRNNVVTFSCFMDNVACNDCPAWVKAFYIFPIISLEYLIPMLYGYYICFYSNLFPKFRELSIFVFVLYYILLFVWFYFWDQTLFRFFPEKTVDNFIYASLFLLNSLLIMPVVKKYSNLKWFSLIKKTKYNTLMLVMAASTFILFINILRWLQEGLRKKDETYQNLYQVCLTIFCVSYESSMLYIMVKRHPTLIEDWRDNNTPLLFIAKNILIFSYAIRFANIAVLNPSQFGFYLQIVTFVQYIMERLSGKSFMTFLLKKLECILKVRKRRGRKRRVINLEEEFEDDDNMICHKIMSYQKIEFSLIYFPRTVYLICFNQWSISEPFLKLVQGCTFKINEKIKINGSSAEILISNLSF